MIASAVLLLFVACLTSARLEPDVNCDFYDAVKVSELVEVENPLWPNTYPAGVTCRWIFDCPIGYVCMLNCYLVELPQSASCHMDKLQVSPVDSPMLQNADVYCGLTTFNSTSLGTRIIMGLSANSESPGGRFRCNVRAENDASLFDVLLGKNRILF